MLIGVSISISFVIKYTSYSWKVRYNDLVYSWGLKCKLEASRKIVKFLLFGEALHFIFYSVPLRLWKCNQIYEIRIRAGTWLLSSAMYLQVNLNTIYIKMIELKAGSLPILGWKSNLSRQHKSSLFKNWENLGMLFHLLAI